MTMNTIGDMAQSFLLRRQTVQTRQEIGILTQELTTGFSANPFRNVAGDYSYLADIERNLSLIGAYSTAASEAEAFTNGMQSALAGVQTVTEEFAATLFELTSGDLAQLQKLTPRMAADTLQQVIIALNSTVAGRSLFAGKETNQPALADADTMMAELGSNMPVPLTADGLRNAVDQWFGGSSSGFAVSGYLGSTTGLQPYRLGPEAELDLDLRANAPVFREVIKALATSVLASDPTNALSFAERSQLLRASAVRLSSAQGGLTGVRADLGFAQERIEEGKVRLASERSSLEIARNSLLSVDPYDSATKLQAAQTRLESIYAVTVRLSRLSLAEFMR